MKKNLFLMLIAVILCMPFVVKADPIIDCTDADIEGIKTCSVKLKTSETDIEVTLTEFGGAEIQSIDSTDWAVNSQNKTDNVWTVSLSGMPDEENNINLLTFTYKVSGRDDCKVEVSLGGSTVPTETPSTTDKPTTNKDTGSTLPYIALGVIALIAGSAYVATKNKTKMYRL